MPSGDNHERGPFGIVPTKNGEGGIGLCTCDVCEADMVVKINKSGWPYAFCTCKNYIRTQGEKAACALVGRIHTWHQRSKDTALGVVDLIRKKSEPKSEHVDVKDDGPEVPEVEGVEASDVVAAKEVEQVKKKKAGQWW